MEAEDLSVVHQLVGMIHGRMRVIRQMMNSADDDAQTIYHASILLLNNRWHCQSHAAECRLHNTARKTWVKVVPTLYFYTNAKLGSAKALQCQGFAPVQKYSVGSTSATTLLGKSTSTTQHSAGILPDQASHWCQHYSMPTFADELHSSVL